MENLELENYTLACIMEWSQMDDAPKANIEEANNYKLISETIDQHDEYDGGSYYTTIIHRLSDNKYFKTSYNDWDYDWEKGDFDNFEPEFTEVFPKTITKVIYE